MAFVSLMNSHHCFHSLRSVFVFFVVFTFRFSSINKEISLLSRSLLVSRNLFSLKTSKFSEHSLFSSGKNECFRPFFHRSPHKPKSEVTFVEDLSVKLVFWSTNTVGYLYSFCVLFVLY